MLKKSGKIWYVRLQMDGKERWLSTHRTSEREAQKAAAVILTAIKRERAEKTITSALLDVVKQMARQELTETAAKTRLADVERLAQLEALQIVDALLPAPPLLASDLWDKYMSCNPELKTSTLKTKRQRFHIFTKWAGDADMKTLKEADCRRFLAAIGTDKSQTINNYISDLSSVWKQSPQLKNPWGEHLRQKSNVVHKLPLLRDEIRKILDYCLNKHLVFWHFAVILDYYTGLRLKDVIYFSTFNIKDGYITLVPQKTDRTTRKVSIPIPDVLQAEIDKVKPMDGSAVFFPDMVKRYEKDRALVSGDFQDILKKTGVYRPGIGFHSIRHTFVTLAMDADIDIKNIQAAVGHTSITLTEGTYYHGIKKADLSGYPTL